MCLSFSICCGQAACCTCGVGGALLHVPVYIMEKKIFSLFITKGRKTLQLSLLLLSYKSHILFFFFSSQMTWPHPWHPDIVDVQIATIGSLAIVAVPGEFTYVFFGLVLHIASESISFKLPAVLLCVGT